MADASRSWGTMTDRMGTADVLVVDDHGLLAQSLTFALRADDLAVELCADVTPEGILDAVERTGPRLVLLDLDLGPEAGTSLPLIDRIQESGSTVVMLTGVTDRVQLAACVEAGAVGIIPKSEPFERLVADVRKVFDGRPILSRHEHDELLADLRRQREADRARLRDFEQLTSREAEVLDGLMNGWSAEQIAEQSFVSITTVRSQIRSVLTKLGVNSQLSAVALARRAGWSLDEDT